MKKALTYFAFIIFIIYPPENSTGYVGYSNSTSDSIKQYEFIKHEIIVNSFFQELKVNKDRLELVREIIKSK